MSDPFEEDSAVTGPSAAPHDLIAEQSALGGMLLSKNALADVLEVTRREDFYIPKHEVIFDAIVTLYAAGEPTDVVAVTDRLIKTGELGKAGGADYVHSLTSVTPSASNAGYYAGIVHEHALRRHVVEVVAAGIENARDGRNDPVAVIDDMRQKLDMLGAAGHVSLEPIGAHAFSSYIDALESKPRYVPTPWWDVNRYVGGFRERSLNVIAARPAMGKSNVALQAATRLALEGPVAYVSLEMGRDEIMGRMIAAAGQVMLQSLTAHELNPGQWAQIAAVRSHIESLPLYVAESDEVSTLAEVRAFARAVARKAPKGKRLAGVVIDYLQLMTSGERVESRQQEVSQFTRSLKLLAQQLGCPVIALSQLNRASAGRKDPRPVLTDLRESGSIEQDADTVWLLHRDPEKAPNDLEVHVAKNRHGQNGRVLLKWEGQFARALSKDWRDETIFAPEDDDPGVGSGTGMVS